MTRPHVILVACAASKQSFPSPARDLYVSTLFVEARRYAESHGDSWFILSALYGVLAPERIVVPYERTLNDMTISQRRDWAAEVGTHLLDVLERGSKVTFLAGKKYREFLEPFLREHGYDVHVPLAHLGIGQQIQWLQRATSAVINNVKPEGAT
jgi:hypothetical protein